MQGGVFVVDSGREFFDSAGAVDAFFHAASARDKTGVSPPGD